MDVVTPAMEADPCEEADPVALSPRFTRESEVASGGMGRIYRTYDARLGRRVAVKVLRPALAQKPAEVNRFLREARITGQLDHPNIVPVHDLTLEADGHGAWFSMKLVQGKTLHATFEELGERALHAEHLERLLRIFLSVCDAVAFAHGHGVLHLDIKPDNVMVGSHGQVYVMDWGLAVYAEPDEHGVLRPSESRNDIRGTPAYMPPEQLSDNPQQVDQRSDVYALGGILHQLLTGEPPFEVARGPFDLPLLRTRYSSPGIERAGHCLPPGLCRIAERALAPVPDDRYPDVESLRADVEAFLHGGGWLEERQYRAGEVIVREGDAATCAFVLQRGTCDVYQGEGEQRVKLRSMGVGEAFGELAIFCQSARTATVVAATDVSVQVVSRESLDRELEGRGWLRSLVGALATRFCELEAETPKNQRRSGAPPA